MTQTPSTFPVSSGETTLSTAFDHAMAQAEAAWGKTSAPAMNREAAMTIVARALGDEIKTGKPLDEVYGSPSLARLLDLAVQAGDIGVFDHLAHDVAAFFGVKSHATQRDLPDNAGVLYTDIHADLTHSYWVLRTEAKKAIATTAKLAWGPLDAAGSLPADPQQASRARDFIDALSGAALYATPAPVVPPRAGVAMEESAPVPKKRLSI